MQGSTNREEGRDAPRGRTSSGESDSGDEHDHDGANGSDADDLQLEDGSDTARIAESVTEYARRCLLAGAFSKAMVALQSAVEIAEMPSLAYRQGVLQSAQVLRAAHEFEASITCMQTIYRHMPTPYTPAVGVLIIAQLYEKMQRWDFGQFWRRKLSGLHNTSVHGVWQALGDQAFELQDFVFAADFYAQSLVDEDEDEGCSSCRTIYRYLFSLTQFTGPCDTTHRQQCQLAAWRVAKKFRWNRTLYGDMDYWRLRDLYAQSFPSIYRAVFEWDAMYAERIARWWKVLCARVSDVDDADSTNAQEAVDNQASPREESKIQKKTTRRRKKRTSEVSAISTVKMPSTTRIMQQPSPKRASPSRRDIKRDKVSVRSNHMGVTGSGTIGSYVGLEDVDTSRSHGASCALLGASKSTPDFYEASPTKRKFGAVRRLRKQRLSDDLSPASPRLDAGGESVPSDAASQPESLLELYPLRTSSSDQSFLLSVGRKPGLAELNMQKLEEFARLAHYRARVIAAQHVEVSALAPERVKPRWLLDFDKAVSLLTSFKRSKQRLDDDSIAHISEVHARLVFQLAAIRRYYVSEFGATAFVLRLQSLILQLSNWRFQRVAELTEVLEATKQMAMEEEKRRNLEFYHVHRG